MKSSLPPAQALAFRDEMLALLRKHMGELDASVVLATAAYTVGQIVALQDQRRMSGAMAMEIVARNIEAGNADAVRGLLDTKGSA